MEEQKKKKQTPFYEKKIRKDPQKMRLAHFHEKHELYYLEKGETKYFLGNEIYLLEAGDMIFVPKNTFHKTDNSENSGVERILFTFDDGIFGEDEEKYLAILKQRKMIRIPVDKQPEIQHILHRIAGEEHAKQIDYAKMQELYFRQLLILIKRYASDPTTEQPSPAYRLVQSLAKYISQHYDEPLSLEFLAVKFNLSPSHLSRTFKTVTGIGLNEYINVSRVTAAEKMLQDSHKSITEVALCCGFNDSNYFAAVFKRIKGVTPKKYAIQNTRQ